MSDLLPFIIVGLVSGSLYGLAGIGLVLTYRTSGVLNLSHGAVAAGAAYLFYTFHVEWGWAWPLAGLATMIVFGLVVGLLFEAITRSMAGAEAALVVVVTAGLLLLVQGVIFTQYGEVSRNMPAFLPESGFNLGDVRVRWDQIVSALVAIVGGGALYAFLRSTRLGTAMRGVVESRTLTRLTGEDPNRPARAAWVIGSAFAAACGILISPTIGLDANLLTLLVVQSFGACAIGAFRSLPLTYVGGLVVGVSASLATRYLTDRPFSGIPSAVPFIILIVVLLVLPDRLPKTRASTRSLVSVPPPRSRGRSWVGSLFVVGALSVVPLVVGSYLPVWISALTYVVIFGSLSLLVWTSGQISLCHLALAALGATTLSHLTEAGVPWLIALAMAGVIAIPVGAVLAVLAIRTSGIYLALVTLGFGILMQNVVFQSDLMFGAQVVRGASRPVLGFVDTSNDRWLYMTYLVIALVVISLLIAVQRGQLGRLLRGIAESPDLLATNGLEVRMTKVLVFGISAFFASVGGGLIITQFGSVSGLAFGPLQSVVLVAVLGLSGTRLVRSSFVAAALIALAPGYISSFDTNTQLVAFGTAAVVAGLMLTNRDALRLRVQRAAAGSRRRLERGPVPARGTAVVAGLHNDLTGA